MRTMLIVEDDPAWRSLYTMEFQRDFCVFEAGDGLTALSMVSWVKPDVILLDLRLPRMSGTDFLRALQRKCIRAPVVVCSGLLPDQRHPPAPAVGAAPKSADMGPLRRAVERALRYAAPARRAGEEADTGSSPATSPEPTTPA
jgi:DNA-binding response OmpR family regulator